MSRFFKVRLLELLAAALMAGVVTRFWSGALVGGDPFAILWATAHLTFAMHVAALGAGLVARHYIVFKLRLLHRRTYSSDESSEGGGLLDSES